MPDEQASRPGPVGAAGIAASVEDAIGRGSLAPGDQLPTVRGHARELGVSPATVNAAYRILRERGLITTQGRGGTRVAGTEFTPGRRLAAPVGPEARNLAGGSPDPALLPALAPVLARLSGRQWLYGEPGILPALGEWAHRDLVGDGLVADDVVIVGGALDGLERTLQAHLRPGDTVAIEDPGYGGVLDLLPALGLRAAPVSLDAHGMRPDGLARALEQQVKACIITPRAQNPTGAALGADRAAELRRVLAAAPDVLVIEDDHAGPVSGHPAVTVAGDGSLPRWAVVRSLTKTLGPDVRVGILTGDRLTAGRVQRRQQAGAGWVSHVLQELAATILTDAATPALLARASETYRARRHALVTALDERGIEVRGDSGFNLWVPVPAETAVTQSLLAAGWAVRAGESFRSATPPGIRVTVATLGEDEAPAFAGALASCLRTTGGSRTA